MLAQSSHEQNYCCSLKTHRLSRTNNNDESYFKICWCKREFRSTWFTNLGVVVVVVTMCVCVSVNLLMRWECVFCCVLVAHTHTQELKTYFVWKSFSHDMINEKVMTIVFGSVNDYSYITNVVCVFWCEL